MLKKSSTRVSGIASDTKPEPEKSKRIYRAILDVTRRLDDIVKQKKAYRDVFLPEAVVLRNRLQDYCERLMFSDPLEYGRKAEELLWRKVYYDIIQLMKHNRKQMRPSSSLETAFRTHLVAATGYYHRLLFKLQLEYNLTLPVAIDFYLVPESRAKKPPTVMRKSEYESKVEESAKKACHRCLIYLGDIARYQQDYDSVQSAALAQRYYYQALALCPDIGMPFNQLGTLAGTRYYNVDAAYHYIRCLTCQTTFEGARGNLARLFEKNRKRYHELTQISPRDLPPEQQRFKDTRRFLVRFMHLMDFFYSDAQKIDPKELSEVCQTALQDFNLVMFYQPPHVSNPDLHSNEGRGAYLDDEIIFKVVVMCMATVYQLQQKGSKQVTASIAFTLALISHILNHVVIRLQSALYELENPRRSLEVDSSETEDKVTSGGTDDDSAGGMNTVKVKVSPPKQQELDNSDEARKAEKHRRLLARLRRRRRRRKDSESTADDNTSSHSEHSDDSDLSEGGVDLDNLSDSGDEVINYLNDSDSSSSEEDNLMVSQELRSGFGSRLGRECDGYPDNQRGSQDANINSINNLNSQLRNGLSSDMSNGMSSELLSEYLTDFPTDLYKDSSNLLSNTLRLNSLLHHDKEGVDGDDETNAEIDEIVKGKKEVSVPPGFDHDPEVKHVFELSEKLANFVIETDTDLSSMPTDTDNSSLPTESEIETTETDRDSPESVIDMAEIEESRLERLLQVTKAEGLLCCVKVACDWLQCNPNVITTCAQSSQALWSRLSVLLNFLPKELELAKISICGSHDVLSQISDAAAGRWKPEHPLREDVHLCSFLPLKDAHTGLRFTGPHRIDLNSTQETLLRICCLRKFGANMAEMTGLQFTYDSEKKLFYGPLQTDDKHDEKAAQQTMVDEEARRNQLMRDMAQLRLQAEVTQLEGSLQSADKPQLPPYLVPEASALCDNLPQIKQLATSARFIIIIPLAVIDHLDILKKENSGAREAIRWLETEFKRGNRYVRAQKSHEKASNAPQKNLKKRDRDTWRFMQIVSVSQYLSKQSSECDPKGMVCVLSNLDTNDTRLSLRLRHVLASIHQEGVLVQKVSEFYTKWKEIWKAGKG